MLKLLRSYRSLQLKYINILTEASCSSSSKSVSDDADSFGSLPSSTFSHRKANPRHRVKRQHHVRQISRKTLPSSKLVTKDASDQFGELAPASVEHTFDIIDSLKRERQSVTKQPTETERFLDENIEELAAISANDPDDSRSEQRLHIRHESLWYAKHCEELSAQGKVAECVAMLELRMLKEDRVTPERLNFNIVLGALGRRGFLKKAFELFQKMKELGIMPNNSTVTSLFNACANCPFPEMGLDRARGLRDRLNREGFQLNRQNFHAMIKVFAKHGDLSTCFTIVDDMHKAELVPDTETFNHLLLAASSDKDAGFRLAVMIWRKMYIKQCKPHIISFHMLLKICKECGVGSPDMISELCGLRDSTPLVNAVAETPKIVNADPDTSNISLGLSSQGPNITTDIVVEVSNAVVQKSDWPSLSFSLKFLNKGFRLPSEVVGIRNLAFSANDRFLLLGGVQGFIGILQKHRTRPNIITFIRLLDLVKNDSQEENELLEAMKTANVKPDAGFCNLIIRRRCLRSDFTSALDVLDIMRSNNLTPDVVTFGCLALGCRKRSQAAEVLNSIKNLKVNPSIQVFTALMNNALLTPDPWYALDLLKEMKHLNIAIDEKFLTCFESRLEKISATQVFLQSTDSSKTKCWNKEYFNGTYFKDGMQTLKNYYDQWIKEVKFLKAPNPWVDMERKIDPESLREDWEKPWLKPRKLIH